MRMNRNYNHSAISIGNTNNWTDGSCNRTSTNRAAIAAMPCVDETTTPQVSLDIGLKGECLSLCLTGQLVQSVHLILSVD